MANSVIKSAFIAEMISSGRDPEEAEQDWLQYLEDYADYRAHKYGNDDWAPSDEEFWGDCSNWNEGSDEELDRLAQVEDRNTPKPVIAVAWDKSTWGGGWGGDEFPF